MLKAKSGDYLAVARQGHKEVNNELTQYIQDLNSKLQMLEPGAQEQECKAIGPVC